MLGKWQWKKIYLVIKSEENQASDRMAQFSLFADKASYYTKNAPIIPKSDIYTLQQNQSSHTLKAVGFQIVTTKGKKYDFSETTIEKRDPWITFVVEYFYAYCQISGYPLRNCICNT